MHVLEAAMFAHLVNSPRRALLDYPATEWREIQELLDARIDDPATAQHSTEPGLISRLKRWLTRTEPRNPAPARSVA
jgi:hypothetical protein